MSPGFAFRPGKAQIRPQAVRLRRSNEARVPQEGKDDQEGRAEIRMHTMQDQGAIGAQALQALRAWVCVHVQLHKVHEWRANDDCSGDKKTKGAALVF